MRRLKKMLVVVSGMVVVLFAVLYLIARPELGAKATGERLERMKAQENFSDGVFVNDEPLNESLMAIFHYLRTAAPSQIEPKQPIDVLKPERFADPEGRLAVTWLGHSTLILEIDGLRILTDPIWAERASPFTFAGPSRFVEVPISIEELPTIDAVLISHDHYDHLDRGSLVMLQEKVPLFVVPLGVGAHLEEWGIKPRKIIELNWWEETNLGSVKLICTPARHFSGRALTDKNATLWASWVISGPDNRIFFGGDGGMGKHFEEIGNRFGPFDLSMLEVGAYSPAWPDVHLGPEQAVMAHKALGAKYFLPIHWGTFVLSRHTWTEPLSRILELNEPDLLMLTPQHGQRIEIHAQAVTKRWWPENVFLTQEQQPIWSTGYEPR